MVRRWSRTIGSSSPEAVQGVMLGLCGTSRKAIVSSCWDAWEGVWYLTPGNQETRISMGHRRDLGDSLTLVSQNLSPRGGGVRRWGLLGGRYS